MQKYIKALLFPVVIVLIGAGCSGNIKSETNQPVTSAVPAQGSVETSESADASHGHQATAGAIEAGSRVELLSSDLEPGNVELAFRIFGENLTRELTTNEMEITHEKKLHLLVVRDDITKFQHLHPEYENESWSVQALIDVQGTYELYLDFDALGEEAVTLRQSINIGGLTKKSAFPSVDKKKTVSVGDLEASLALSPSAITGEHLQATFAITEGGEAVDTINPYLGAFGHVVILGHADPDVFIHAHPITENSPQNGEVVFETEFSKAGIYTIFGQFNVDGEIVTFPITVSIGEPTVTDGNHHEGEINVAPHGHEEDNHHAGETNVVPHDDVAPHDDTNEPPRRH